jgi:hypothetical protein
MIYGGKGKAIQTMLQTLQILLVRHSSAKTAKQAP